MVAGFDQSASSIAGAAMAYDHTLRKIRGPQFEIISWGKGDHYFDRLAQASKSWELVIGLQSMLGISIGPERIWIAQEEPFPPGDFVRRGNSQALKQQAEISGAFLGGLLRFGFTNLWQIGNHNWRGLVADELGISIHFSKWSNATVKPLPQEWNAHPKHTGKFRAKQWALRSQWDNLIPQWPDLINSKDGKISRPDGSRAKAMQSDDRYEAIAICEWLRRELFKEGVIGIPD